MGKSKKFFTVSVLSEHRVEFYGDCSALTVATSMGTITVLSEHTPIIAKLGQGSIIGYVGRSIEFETTVEGGIICVYDNEAIVLLAPNNTDHAPSR